MSLLSITGWFSFFSLLPESFNLFWSDNRNLISNILIFSMESNEISRFKPGGVYLAKWEEDNIWYRARVDSVKGLSLNITFIDYGNSVTVNLEHILEETDDIPTEELEMVDYTVWKYEKETIYVNGKPVIVGKNLPAKTVLSMFCEQNNLSYPNYQLTVENENNPEWITFRAYIELDGKCVVGSGRKKMKAETAAARKYINNKFQTERNSFPSGNLTSSTKRYRVKPSMKAKQLKKMTAFNQRKAEAAEIEKSKLKKSDSIEKAGSSVCQGKQELHLPDGAGGQSPCKDLVGQMKDVSFRDVLARFVGFDNERSGGPLHSELIQLAYTDSDSSGNSYIMPKGGICPEASKHSHNLIKENNKLMRGKEVYNDESLATAARRFVEYLKNVKIRCGEDPVLVCHGDDIITLLNSFALVGYDKALVEVIGGVIDFQEVLADDERLNDIPKSLTKIRGECKNLSETVLGDQVTREEILKRAHDAMFDAELVLRVFKAYLHPPWSSSSEFVEDTYIVPASSLIEKAKMKISRMILKRSRKLKQTSTPYIMFNGWDGSSSSSS